MAVERNKVEELSHSCYEVQLWPATKNLNFTLVLKRGFLHFHNNCISIH